MPLPIPIAVLFAATFILSSGCQRSELDVIPTLVPPKATAYAQDDATTDRVLIAFADLHRALHEGGDESEGSRWEPRYYQLPADSRWPVVREQLDQQVIDTGWTPDSGLAESGAGYLRRVWRNGSQRVAAAYVEPPVGSRGATVLVVLTPRER